MEKDVYLQLGAMGIILVFSIKEFFAYLKSKGNGNGMLNGKILEELRLMNNNHLNALKEAIETGNRRLIDCIHEDNLQIIGSLNRLLGRLDK